MAERGTRRMVEGAWFERGLHPLAHVVEIDAQGAQRVGVARSQAGPANCVDEGGPAGVQGDAESISALTPRASRWARIPSKGCSVPTYECPKLRASSGARTTTWRAPPVNRSNIIASVRASCARPACSRRAPRRSLPMTSRAGGRCPPGGLQGARPTVVVPPPRVDRRGDPGSWPPPRHPPPPSWRQS